MARLFRLTFAFDELKQGWSESWMFLDNTIALKDKLDRFMPLAILRRDLLGSGAALSHMRVSQVLDNEPDGNRTPRVSLGRDLNLQATTSNKLCQPHDSLLVSCLTSDQLHKKNVFLGGVWMRCFDELRHFVPVDDFGTRFNAWAAEVKLQGLGWQTQLVDQDLSITGYTQDVDTANVTYTLSGPLTFTGSPPRKRVVVNFPGGHEALDGPQVVGPVTGEPNKAITIKPRGTHAYRSIVGSLKTYKYSFVALGPTPTGGPAASIDPQRASRRSRGAPLYAEAGRRPVQARG